MSDHDKPFACKVRGCGQTFTNNDRLIVHRQTHSLKVQIGKKGEESIPDQTPTPTRFLKNCDEEGLFEELGENDDNPFDRDFKSATKQPYEKKTLETTVVNTPVPVTELPLPTKRRVDDIETDQTDPGLTAPPAVQTVEIDGRNGTIPSATDFLSQTAQTSEQVRVVDTKLTVKSPTVSVLVTRSTNSRKAVPAFIAHPGNAVPKATPAPLTIVSNAGNVQSIPARAIVVTPTGTGNSGSFVKSAKQILKETIRIHQSQGKDVKTDLGNIITQAMDEAASVVKRPSYTQDSDSSKEKDAKPIKRSRKSQEDLTPDEKREKFLERNRAAATRCREKRKMWITALEKKAEEMSELNSQLQNEISYLKHEVAQLKALLLAHRDCPLSVNQQKANPGLFEQLTAGNPAVVIDITGTEQHTAEVAASALTQMAERATMELETSCNI